MLAYPKLRSSGTMGKLIIGWAEQKRAEQSVAVENMLTPRSMAPIRMSAMQLHNNTEKIWPKMFT